MVSGQDAGWFERTSTDGYIWGWSITRIAVRMGEEGAPDSERVVYYGSVHRVGDELWMWYLGAGLLHGLWMCRISGQDAGWFERVCFATSTDGYNWHKPDLGLVEYKGSLVLVRAVARAEQRRRTGRQLAARSARLPAAISRRSSATGAGSAYRLCAHRPGGQARATLDGLGAYSTEITAQTA